MLQEVLGGAYSLGLSHELTDGFVNVSFEPEETEGVRGEDLPPVIFAYGQGH